MKTKYKYIEFKQFNSYQWIIFNHKYKEQIGELEYHRKWKQWELIPGLGTGWTKECLVDVTHFIDQLQTPLKFSPPEPLSTGANTTESENRVVSKEKI